MLGQECGLYAELTALENLLFAGRMYGVANVHDRAAATLGGRGARAAGPSPGRTTVARHAATTGDRPGTGARAAADRARRTIVQSGCGRVVSGWSGCSNDGGAQGGPSASPVTTPHRVAVLADRIVSLDAGRIVAIEPADCPPTTFAAERMMPAREPVKSLWWLIHKDLTRELRAQHVWPGMVLLGLVLVFLLATQIDLPAGPESTRRRRAAVAGHLFCRHVGLDRSFTNERDAGCWQALTLYPIAPSVLFLAKMAVNLAALVILELVLVPAFIVLTDVPFAARPGPLLLIAALGNVGFAAVGTLVSGLTAGLRHRGGLLTLLAVAVGDAGRFRRGRGNPPAARRRDRSDCGGSGFSCWPSLPPCLRWPERCCLNLSWRSEFDEEPLAGSHRQWARWPPVHWSPVSCLLPCG